MNSNTLYRSNDLPRNANSSLKEIYPEGRLCCLMYPRSGRKSLKRRWNTSLHERGEYFLCKMINLILYLNSLIDNFFPIEESLEETRHVHDPRSVPPQLLGSPVPHPPERVPRRRHGLRLAWRHRDGTGNQHQSRTGLLNHPSITCIVNLFTI